jgi:3-hydroxyisobutyrate dehydrogenase-like beta-hydroxyacid dehydrogenase
MELSALHHIVRTSDELGLDTQLPRLLHALAAQAVDNGHGADGWSRVIDLLRQPSKTPGRFGADRPF